MRCLVVAALLLSGAPIAATQSSLRVLVRDERTHALMPGATVVVPALNAGTTTDTTGRATLPGLPDGPQRGRGYWLMGALAEKTFAPHFSVVVNAENIFVVRQTQFEQVVTGPVDRPTFRPLYALLDGIVANIAIKITL